MNDVPFIQRLQAVVDDTTPETRPHFQASIEGLTAHGITSFDDLLTTATTTADPDMQVSACWLLGVLGHEQAVDALLRAMANEHPVVAQQAGAALAQIGSQRAVEPLLHILAATTGPAQRAAAIYALGGIGDRRAVAPLLRILADPAEAAAVRGHAAEVLAAMPEARDDTLPALRAALGDMEPEVRFWAAFALGALRDAASADALQRLAAQDTAEVPGWWSVRQEAQSALDQINQPPDEDE